MGWADTLSLYPNMIQHINWRWETITSVADNNGTMSKSNPDIFSGSTSAFSTITWAWMSWSYHSCFNSDVSSSRAKSRRYASGQWSTSVSGLALRSRPLASHVYLYNISFPAPPGGASTLSLSGTSRRPWVWPPTSWSSAFRCHRWSDWICASGRSSWLFWSSV